MPSLDSLQLLFDIIQVAFAFAFGACIGSLINVLVYRLPLGIGVVTPPSACPSCGTRLTWRENIPVLGWLALRGRCRFCRSPVSAEYPIVEATVGLLFVLLYLIVYGDADSFMGLGRFIPLHSLRPHWSDPAVLYTGAFRATWPLFLIWLILTSSLVAMTLVDAKTFTIPLVLTQVPAVVGFVGHLGFAAYIQATESRLPHASGWWWAIPTPGPHGWWWIGGSLGAIVGLTASNILLAKGIFSRSFSDYESWEKEYLQANAGDEKTKTLEPSDLWLLYPHARREVLREVIFLSPVIGFGLAGAALAAKLAGPATFNAMTGTTTFSHAAPLWLMVLSGVCLGYLVGGGLVWFIRILGTLAFRKEAMGLGDVHLMAGVGACLGWIDATIGFFGAAFVGVAWASIGALSSGRLKRQLPYGPYLAIATVLVMLCKPLVEKGLNALMPSLGGIQIP